MPGMILKFNGTVEAYDFTSKPELVKQIAREFFEREQDVKKPK